MDPVEPGRSGVSSTTCGGCPTSRLSFPAHQVVKLLVRPAELHVGLDRDGVVRLAERVQELVQMNRQVLAEPLLEVVALEQPVHGRPARQLDDVVERHRAQPLAVEHDARPLGIQNQAVLLAIGARVVLDLVRGQRRARFGLARRVPDQPREVADHENRLVAEILKLPELLQDDRVAEVNVGGGGVQPELDAQRAPLPELLEQRLLADDLHGAASQQGELLARAQRCHARIIALARRGNHRRARHPERDPVPPCAGTIGTGSPGPQVGATGRQAVPSPSAA